jgi:WD40 repeat protein
MNLDDLLAVLQREGPKPAARALAAARQAAPDDEGLAALGRVLDLEAASLSTWRRRDEPAFALQQLRNAALACGLEPLRVEVEAALAALGRPWLAALALPAPPDTGLVRRLRGAPGDGVSPLAPGARCTVSRARGRVELRDVETGALVVSRAAVPGALLRAGGRLLEVSGRVRLRDLVNDQVLLEVRRRGSRNVAVSPGGQLVAFGDAWFGGFDGEFSGSSRLELRETATGQQRWVVGACARPNRDVPLAFSPDGRHLLFDNEVVRVSDGRRVGGAGRSAGFTADGRSVVSIGGISDAEEDDHRHAIHVRALPDGPRQELAVDGQLDQVAVSPDGTRVAALDAHGTQVSLWDLATGERRWSQETHEVGTSCLRFLGVDGPLVIAHRFVTLLDPANGALLGRIAARARPVTAVEATPDGRFLVLTDDHEVEVRDLGAILKAGRAAGPVLHARTAALTPAGDRGVLVRGLGWAGTGGTATLVRIDAAGPVVETTFETNGADPALSPDGAWLLAVAPDGALLRVRVRDGARTVRQGLTTASWKVGWRADGAWILGWSGAELRGWPADPGPRLVRPDGAWQARLPGRIVDLASSPEGRLLAVAHGDGARALEATTGRELHGISGPADRVAIADDGFLVLTGPRSPARVVSLATGRIAAHGQEVATIGAVPGPGGRWVLTEQQGRLIVEERSPGEAALTRRGAIPGSVASVVFAADGESVATATRREGLSIWHLPTLRRRARVLPPLAIGGAALDRDLRRVLALGSQVLGFSSKESDEA